jgi:hypothetical protein
MRILGSMHAISFDCHPPGTPISRLPSGRSHPRSAQSARRLRTTLAPRSLLYLLTSLFLLVSPLLAKELRIERFNAQIDILPDSSVTVTESITARFIGGPWHGLYREIPVEYVTPQGMNYSLFLDVKRVTDGAGHRLK